MATNTLVLVGASAGGLEALRELIRSVPPNAPVCMVVAQHLSPSHESLLTTLLARETALPVVEAHGALPLVSEGIYVVPPGHNATVDGDILAVTTATAEVVPKPSINLLFESAAQEHGDSVIGVVLSGTGTDGAEGLLALKRSGGTTFVQNPDEATYDGMPKAAIRTGGADYILPAIEIGQQIGILAERAVSTKDGDLDNGIVDILELLAKERGIDLSQYKPTTIRRRLKRRMTIRACETVDSYLTYLRADEEELDLLVGDLFINVTRFFRDPDYFEMLEEVMANRMERQPEGTTFRAWVAGCASGEEAYSIAMLLHDVSVRLDREITFQVFASDIDADAIATARRGRYSADSLAQLTPERLRHHFAPDEPGFWRVRPNIRERVLFSLHDLAKDPPFSQIDLVTCRNVLIYMGSGLQERLMNMFAYGLVEDGVLFLGRSESASRFEHLFRTLDARARIYARRPVSVRLPVWRERLLPRKGIRPMGSTAREREAPPPEVGIYRQIARMFAPPALLVNDQDELIFTSNGAARYTLLREGRFTIDVYDLVLPDLRASLRAVLFRARRTGRAIRVPITLESDGNAKHNVIIEATPFDYSQPNWILVTLIETADANPVEDGAEGADGPVIQVLEMELAATRDNLQTLVEELETINEELQTTNEELQSTTEEAQVTNEQLQTSNEELQSSNEELRTLNDELQAKNNELERLYTELVALDGSLRVPFLVLDSELRIRRIGRHAGLVLAAEGVRVGDLLGAVEWLGPPPDEIALFRVGAVTTGTSIWTCGGRTWRVEVSEYALGIGLAPGYLISFHELTQVILERNRAEHTERTLAKTIASIHEAVIRVDARGLVEFVNDAAALLLEADREQLKGQAYARALRLQGSATADEPVPDYVRMVLETGQPVRSEHLVWLETGQRRRMVEVAVTPVEGDDHSQVEGVVVIVRDVTEREDLLSELSWRGSHDKLTGLENRIAFDQALEEVRQRAILTGQAAWLLLMDLDRFKPVNDVAGHAVGDAVLREISNVMRGAIRTSDRLFRVGGDEFALLLEGIGLPVVEKIARKMVGEVRRYRPNAPADSFRLGVSIGITAIHVGVGRTEADLIRDADLALYRVKASGGGGFRIAQPREVEGAPTPTESVYQRLCEALEGHRLILMAQPIVPLRGGPTMFEILTRLPGPDGTLISPNEFIPMAERYALMPEVDEQVIAETLRYLAERERTGVPLPVLCLNLSGRSVANPLFMARLKPLLDQYESLIPQLVFEVTETAAIFDLAQASATLSQLRQRGAFTALDDFGAGNATFDALKSLDVQFVKLDRKFVAGMRDEPFNRACVEAMCRVAQALKKRIVAEGIERELLVSDLAALGVEYGQGWYFGRPVRLDELAPAETYPHGPLRSL